MRHWSLGAFAWNDAKTTWGWVDKDSAQQARILFDQLDDLDEYFLGYFIHVDDESRPDQSTWYQVEPFLRSAELFTESAHKENEENAQETESVLVRACDVDVAIGPLISLGHVLLDDL